LRLEDEGFLLLCETPPPLRLDEEERMEELKLELELEELVLPVQGSIIGTPL